MADPGAPDLADEQIRAGLIAQKTPRQLAGLYQWWAARQIDQRLIGRVRHQIILELSQSQGLTAAAEFLRALIGQ